MGIRSWLRGDTVTATTPPEPSREIDVGRPPVPPAGGLAPSITYALTQGLDDPYLTGTGMIPRYIALQVPAVRRGVRVISGAIASMMLERWRGFEQIDPGPLLIQPEPDRPYVTSLTLTVEDLILYPYAWWLVIERDYQGYPSRVRRLEPEHVTIQRDWDTGGVERVFVTYRGREVPERNLIRFDGPDEGLLCLGQLEILTGYRLEVSAQTYADPQVPSGVLKNTGQYAQSREEMLQTVTDWETARRTRATGYLNANLDYVTTMAMPDQLQLVQGREETAAQIARLLNLPPRYVGAKSGDSMTYSTVTAERRDLIDLSLTPYMKPIEQRLSMSDGNGSPRGQTVAFDPSFFLRQDPREQAEVSEIEIRSGVSTVPEQRALRGLPPESGAAA